MSWFTTTQKIIARFLPQEKQKPLAIPKATAVFTPASHKDILKQDQPHACLHYTRLKTAFRDIGRMNAIIEALGRDFLTAMPEGAYKSRLGQMAFLHRRLHEDLISENVQRCLDEAQNHQYKFPGEWDEWDTANLREMSNMYRMYCHVDPALMERKARLSHEGRRRHREVTRNCDWEQGQKFLREQIDLHRRIADARCRANDNIDTHYQMLMEEYMPGLAVSQIEDWFVTMNKTVRDVMPRILEQQNSRPMPMDFDGEHHFDSESQMWLNRSLLKVLGFDFDRGGLYETGHNPVEGGTVDDTRLVISNVDESNFLDSLKSALHEGGHGLYIQGLPRETWRYQPVAMDMGAAMQESQALLIEMILGRTPEFFEFISPRLEGLFHGIHDPAFSPENLYALKNFVKPGVYRRKADEVTYFHHIQVRFKIERDLIDGSLKVGDLPEAWVENIQKTLGVVPQNHIEGCLQDVHWFVGKFGYFASYAVGHMIAAQQFAAMRKQIPELREQIKDGDFRAIKQWLNDNIHSKGRLIKMDDMMIQSTGHKLKPDFWINHVTDRYCYQTI